MKIFSPLSAGALALAVVSAVHGAEIANRKMAWAHHTPWHTPFNTSLTAINYYNFPLQDSTGSDQEDWKREFLQARAQGIDGFFPDLPNEGGLTVFSDTLHTMLKAAEGTDFQIGICLDVKTNVDHQVKELARMLNLFGKHPNYPQWNGRPVVNFYTYLGWTPEELAAIRAGVKAAGHDIFIIGNIGGLYERRNFDDLRPYVEQADMIYSFAALEVDGTTMQSKVELYEQLAAACGKELMTTVYPGYYGAWLNGRNDYYQVHRGFDQAHHSFETANIPKAKFLHYTTWNDHDETSLMPMVFTPANPLITRAYTARFKGESMITGEPEVVFAYHREELPGTLLRFEAMTLPTLEKGSVAVSGRLLDAAGEQVAVLPEKRLNGADFDRVEWLVSSTEFAANPFVTPEFTVAGRTVRLPQVFLVSGWHQNAVTIKTAASQIVMPKSDLQLRLENGRLRVSGHYDSPAELKRVSLWRNDRPLAVILPETEGKELLNLYISSRPDFKVVPEGGKIIAAVQKFVENSSKNFHWNAASLAASANLPWTPVALTVAGDHGMKLRFSVAGNEPLTLSAEELALRERVEYGGTVISLSPVDGTMQNRAALNRKAGTFDFFLLDRSPRRQDCYSLHFETVDGRNGWSVPLYPFAEEVVPVPVKLVETATNLETPSGATGWKGRSEYLAKNIPFCTPKLRETAISPLSIRGGHWDFENDGRDAYGDMFVEIPKSMFADGADAEGRALRFFGKESVKMRLRTYPVGASTIEFLIRPDGKREDVQGVITRSGWSEAVNIYLLPDGRIEAVRNGNEEFKEEKAISRASLPDGSWSRVRVVCDNVTLRIYFNGKCVGEEKISPQRSYGNCTWYLGKGDNRSSNFTGMLDALTVFGAAFAPSDLQEPKFKKSERFRQLLPPGPPEAEEAGAVTGSWNFPETLERRDAAEAPTFSKEWQKNPILIGNDTLLLGPGANTVTVPAEGVALADNTMLTVRLRRFDRAKPQKAWYALLVSIGDGEQKSVNFNFGSNDEVMISANEPEWKIKTGYHKLTLPVDLKIAKRNGFLIFMVNDEVIYKAEDIPEKPYLFLSFSTSSPNCDDAAIVQLDAPVLRHLR